MGANGWHPVQKAWMRRNAPQCGYCRLGAHAGDCVVEEKPHPTDPDIVMEMACNICPVRNLPGIRAAIKLGGGEERLSCIEKRSRAGF